MGADQSVGTGFLPPDQLEHLERDRAHIPATLSPFACASAGEVRLGDEVIGVGGETSVDLSAAEWSGLLPRLG
jgi:hypothetical protein